MAVTSNTRLNSGVYTELKQIIRGGRERSKPVATAMVEGEATGAAGGGLVTVNITVTNDEFGFRAILVPVAVFTNDNLATPEVVQVAWPSAQNKRMQQNVSQAFTPLRVNSINLGKVEASGMLIEPFISAASSIVRAVWATNTDTKVYNLAALFMVYDLEMMEREGEVGALMEGIR